MWRGLCLLSLLITSCAANVSRDGKPEACAHALAAARGLPIRPGALYDTLRADADTDVLHYDLALSVDVDAERLEGRCITTATVLADVLLTYTCRLDDAFTIGPVEVGGVPVSWQRLDAETIEITLDRPYATGETFDVTIDYEGEPQAENWGSIVFTDVEGEPLVYTLSQPWFAYTWWPAKDDLTDKATGALRITVPSDLTVASNGVLLSETDLGDGRTEFHWQTDYQTDPYLFCFSASVYNRFSGVWAYADIAMPLEFMIFPGSDTPDNRDRWLRSGDMLTVFSDVFGVYPFADEKYGIYEFGFGGGMEHQTMTGQGTFSEWITAHEAGHQWWGDMITCATWHDIWLNEGFATYSEALWMERKGGGIDTQALIDHMADRRPGRVDDSVYCYDLSNVGRIFSGNFTYRKGAWVLHQLRHVVGDDAFFDILAAYRQAFEYSAATTADFQQIVENVTGADYDWFFDEWVYDIGAPSYRYGWRALEAAGLPYAEIFVEQVQTTDYPLFIMPIDIVVTQGAAEVTHVVWNDASAQHFLLPLDETAQGLAFDPQQWILREAADETAFAPGPARIVKTIPAPGLIVDGDSIDRVRIRFHKDVIAVESDFEILDSAGQAIGFDLLYDAQALQASLITDVLLGPGSYTVTVRDTLVDVEAGLPLDGEFEHEWNQPVLPSGDGVPGGAANFSFRILHPADLDFDGDIDQQDLAILLAAYEFDDGGDVDDDGDTDQSDLGILLANYGFGTL